MNNAISAAGFRILKLLRNGACKIEPSSCSEQLLLHVQQGAVAVQREDILNLAATGLLVRKGNCLSLSAAGSDLLQSGVVVPLQTNKPTEKKNKERGDGRQINYSESPLAALHKKAGKNGKPFLSRAEFLAGERLRADFTKGHMLPSVTMRWDVTSVGRNSAARGAPFNMSDTAPECRNRVNQALNAVGPELSGLLIDTCCFLKGIELVERERKLPARSAKMLLKVGLSMLDRHYHPETNLNKTSGDITHWGAPDYRPQIQA